MQKLYRELSVVSSSVAGPSWARQSLGGWKQTNICFCVGRTTTFMQSEFLYRTKFRNSLKWTLLLILTFINHIKKCKENWRNSYWLVLLLLSLIWRLLTPHRRPALKTALKHLSASLTRRPEHGSLKVLSLKACKLKLKQKKTWLTLHHRSTSWTLFYVRHSFIGSPIFLLGALLKKWKSSLTSDPPCHIIYQLLYMEIP